MLRLSSMLFAVIATTLMGTAVVAVLTMRMDTAKPVMLAAAAGFLVSIPVSWLIAKKLLSGRKA